MTKVRSSRWEDACTAAAVLSVDPTGVAGISLRSAAGPVRDRWLAHTMQLFPRRCHWHRIPLSVGDDRLLGGLDLAATLRAGHPVAEQGVLAQADGGVLLLSMAERISLGTAAKIGCVLDRHEIVVERDGFARRVRSRFAVVALDEGIEPDERPPDSLLDRLGLHVDLNGLSMSATVDAGEGRYDIPRARRSLSQVRVADEMLAALCEVSATLGVGSARAAWFALRVARAITALDGRAEVSEVDVALAARLVLAPRALMAPSERQPDSYAGPPPESRSSVQPPPNQPSPNQLLPEQPSPEQLTTGQPAGPQSTDQQSTPRELTSPQSTPQQEPSPEQSAHQGAAESLSDRVLAAATASLPPNFLSQLSSPHARNTHASRGGRSGAEHGSSSRGRPAGTRAGELRSGARVNVVETLRAAAPWQRIRRLAAARAAEPSGATSCRPPQKSPLIRVIKDDIRLIRFMRRNRSTTIFLVDASGSAALHRLAEVKGAVELMLAESYVRRDRVALISFRGSTAQMLLPPTNSLVRAKRELAGLPGGGATPLAIGIDTARVLADSLKRRGESPTVVILTDGRSNITRDGKGNRVRAEADAVNAARMMRTNSISSLMVDTAPQPRVSTERFAREMGARYVPLPYADAGALASVVSRHTNV